MEDKLTTEGPPSYTAAVGGAPPPVGDFKGYPPQSGGAAYPPEPQAPYSSQPQPPPTGAGAYSPPSYQPYPQGVYPSQAYTPYTQQQTSNNVVVVTNQPGVLVGGVAGRKPENYMVLSIVSIFCFCWLFGLIALVHSLQVDSAWARGDTAAAFRSSRSARGWNIAAIVGGVVSVVAVIILSVATNTVRYSSYNY